MGKKLHKSKETVKPGIIEEMAKRLNKEVALVSTMVSQCLQGGNKQASVSKVAGRNKPHVPPEENVTLTGCMTASNCLESNLVIYIRSHPKNSYPLTQKLHSRRNKAVCKMFTSGFCLQ